MLTHTLIPTEHAATVLHALCMGSVRAVCTLHASNPGASIAMADWGDGDARDAIPPYLNVAIRTGRIRPDCDWSKGPCDWLVALLDAAEVAP